MSAGQRLRRQRRQVAGVASAGVLALVVVCAVGPVWLVWGVAGWLLGTTALMAGWVGACTVGQWRTARRARPSTPATAAPPAPDVPLGARVGIDRRDPDGTVTITLDDGQALVLRWRDAMGLAGGLLHMSRHAAGLAGITETVYEQVRTDALAEEAACREATR